MRSLFNYIEGNTFIHRLSGLSKLIGFMALTTTVMLSYDIRVILFVLCFSLVTMRVAEIRLKQIKLILLYVSLFLIMNFCLTFLFEPEYGVSIYGTRHVLFSISGRYVVTQEQLFYQVTKLLKYASVIPLGIIFLSTTNPSEFAASLNKIGISYKVGYALALTLRYFPDMQRQYFIISKAQQAKGLDLSKKTSIFHRLKYGILTVIPLIFSSLGRIDTISNAMDLRGFGKHKKRTWYSTRKVSKGDMLTITVTLTIFAISLLITIFVNQSRFYNPFV